MTAEHNQSSDGPIIMQSLHIGADLVADGGLRIRGSVQACFREAAHIQLEDGRLLTLLSGTAQQGMRMVNIAAPDWKTMRALLKAGDEVSLDRQALRHSAFSLRVDTAPVWRSPAAQALLAGASNESLRSTLADAQTWLAQQWLAGPCGGDALWQHAYALFDTVAAALSAADPALESAVRATIGSGPGLTPSGDDMLAGLLIGLYAGGDRDRAASVYRHVRRYANDTSLASRDTLEQAGRGWLNARLADVLAAAGKANRQALQRALAAQSRIGHYSGHDTLIGLFAGIEAALPQRSVLLRAGDLAA